VYRQCDVDKRARWINESAVRTNYRPPTPPAAARNTGTICYDGDLEFVVDERGLPEVETARVVRATDPETGNAVLQSLPQWRFEPAQKGGVPVRQIVRERHIVAAMTVTAVVVRQGQTTAHSASRSAKVLRSTGRGFYIWDRIGQFPEAEYPMDLLKPSNVPEQQRCR
jgi:hypothetical protein